MALIDSFTLSQDATFLSKVRMACIKAANTAITAGTNGLVEPARRVIADPAGYASLVAQMIAVSDTTIAAGAPGGLSLTDAQIQNAVNTLLPNLVR